MSKAMIQLKNIDLSNLTLADEQLKDVEEKEEFVAALLLYLHHKTDDNKKHLIEETCDRIQVLLSYLGIIDIEPEEIAEYWNTEHLEKLKNRPRNK